MDAIGRREVDMHTDKQRIARLEMMVKTLARTTKLLIDHYDRESDGLYFKHTLNVDAILTTLECIEGWSYSEE